MTPTRMEHVMDIIPTEDLLFTASPYGAGKGGQHAGINKGVMASHVPTGLTVICEIGLSQHINRLIAVEMIEAALTSPWFKGQPR